MLLFFFSLQKLKKEKESARQGRGGGRQGQREMRKYIYIYMLCVYIEWRRVIQCTNTHPHKYTRMCVEGRKKWQGEPEVAY